MAHPTQSYSPRTRAVLRKSRRRGRADEADIDANGSVRSDPKASAMLQMQKVYGNRSVSRMLAEKDALQRKDGDKESNKVPEERIQAFVKEHPDHAHLLEGIAGEMTETDIVGRLIENFFSRSDFNYDFSEKAPFKHSGDCNTLVHEFVTIAKSIFGIQMEIKSDEGGFFIAGGGKIVHKDNVTGNIDGGKHFYFETHTWAIWQGKPIDVLFGQLGVVSHLKGVKVEYGADHMPFWNANGFIFFLKHGAVNVFDRYTSNFQKRMKL